MKRYGVIEYGGEHYEMAEGGAQVGDIIKSVLGYSSCPYGAYFNVVDAGGDVAYVSASGTVIINPFDEDFTVFRRVTTALTTAQLIEQKRIELAELEAKLAEESTLKVGDYARVTDGGGIVRIERIDRSDYDDYPYLVRLVNDSDEGTHWISAAERLTPAEARAALIAQIDELFEGSDAE